MAFRNTQYLLQVNSDGTFRHGQVDRVEVLAGGREVAAPPVDLEQAALSGLLSGFNADLLRENESLKASAAQAVVDRQAQFDAISEQTAAAITSRDLTIISLTKRLAAAESELTAASDAAGRLVALEAENRSLRERIARLIEQLAFDPRQLTVEAFLNRLTQSELLMLFSDSDPIVQQIAGILKEWAAKQWPVHLDSDNMRQSIGYLVSTDKLTPDRVQAITADASRAESVPPTV